jgi:hypothetical protein
VSDRLKENQERIKGDRDGEAKSIHRLHSTGAGAAGRSRKKRSRSSRQEQEKGSRKKRSRGSRQEHGVPLSCSCVVLLLLFPALVCCSCS